jgi:hypothetical protein
MVGEGGRGEERGEKKDAMWVVKRNKFSVGYKQHKYGSNENIYDGTRMD